MSRRFRQVDVFASGALRGNPVAVVLDSEGLSTEEMQRFANWMNLSETTFVLPPGDGADYRVRIFTPTEELPFAGHPTLGTAHAWREAGGQPRRDGQITQECPAGLVTLRQTAAGLAFQAPPLRRSGPVSEEELVQLAPLLGISRADIVDAAYADNGPHWVAVMLASAEEVLACRLPPVSEFYVGLVGPYPAGSPAAFEVRAFFPAGAAMAEDPVTGSLNAGIAPWLWRTGRAAGDYVVSQGTVLGRAGRVHITRDGEDGAWVGGATVTYVSGEVDL